MCRGIKTWYIRVTNTVRNVGTTVPDADCLSTSNFSDQFAVDVFLEGLNYLFFSPSIYLSPGALAVSKYIIETIHFFKTVLTYLDIALWYFYLLWVDHSFLSSYNLLLCLFSYSIHKTLIIFFIRCSHPWIKYCWYYFLQWRFLPCLWNFSPYVHCIWKNKLET